MNIIKFAIPLAALICFGGFAPLADAAPQKKSSSVSKSSAKKKSSSSAKKGSKSSKSAQSKKSKSKSSTAQKKGKTEQRTAKVETASNSWIDDLPPVELPTVSGPAEDELLEPVDATDADTEVDADAEPDPEP